MKSGIINVYKEPGYTSFDVVARLRGILRIKKIGHTGTLDPMATGVLPVCIGKATKVCGLLTDKDKSYRATMLLGTTTDTLDTSGTVISESPINVTAEQVQEALLSFLGESMQLPPMYSALKVDGKRLYELAREGREVERKLRPINVSSIEIHSINLPYVSFSLTCSKGTYVRSIIADAGEKLGCGACMSALERVRVSAFCVEEALKLSEIEALVESGDIEQAILPIDQIFEEYFPATAILDVTKRLENGGDIFISELEEPWRQTYGKDLDKLSEKGFRVYAADGRFVGLFTLEKDRLYLKKMFLE